jgi:hypothetical protein
MHHFYLDCTSDLRLLKLAKHFSGMQHADYPKHFAIPQNRVSAFNAAAFSEGLYLKHKSSTGIYHYSSKGLINV